MYTKPVYRLFLVVLFLVVLFLLPGRALFANPINYDFSNGLTAWTTIGEVAEDNETAVLSDTNYASWSVLYQGESAVTGSYTIEFDFKNGLSAETLEDDPFGFSFPDVFFASIYFVDDLSTFYLDIDPDNSSYNGATALFDMDYIGAYSNDDDGIIDGTISELDNGWYHFSLVFENTFNYIIPTFELMDWNFINDDSQVWIDNVQLTANQASPVPEPTTLLLMLTGLGGLGFGFQNKKRKKL